MIFRFFMIRLRHICKQLPSKQQLVYINLGDSERIAQPISEARQDFPFSGKQPKLHIHVTTVAVTQRLDTQIRQSSLKIF